MLVFGASGYVGTNLVPALLAAGAGRVRAAARNRKVLEARPWEGVELVEADALEPDTLGGRARRRRHRLLPGALDGGGRDFGGIDLEAAQNSRARRRRPGSAASSISAASCRATPIPSTSCRARKPETGCARARCPVTEVRAGIIVGPGSAAYEVMRDLVYHLPLMVTPKWVQSKSSPIALANLLVYLPGGDAAGGRRTGLDAGGRSTCVTRR